MAFFRKAVLSCALATAFIPAVHADYNGKTWLEVEARVSAILDNMSLDEKINFIRVNDGRMIPAAPRFGIDGTVAYDSTMGVHVNNGTFGASYPSQTALAATWNFNRAKELGLALGYETRSAGGEQLLSPVVNVYRTPLNGRAAESICGEDPFLCSVLAPALTNGIQAQGIQASAKHLVANEQEANRHFLDVQVDERTLRELYLSPFESLVKNADIASLMCGFNKVNGEYACENHHVITDIVKGEWGYQGFVMSDFNSIVNGFEGAWAGTDLDMPSGLAFTHEKLVPLVYSNQLPMVVIDDKVKRNLRALVRYGFDEQTFEAQTLEHPEYGQSVSLDIAREGIVLLKNTANHNGNALLPLDRGARIAVIGDFAQQAPSSPLGTAYSVPESDYVTELEGIRMLNNSDANVEFIDAMSLTPDTADWQEPNCNANCETGVVAEYFYNNDFSGEPAVTRVEEGMNFNWLYGTNSHDGVVTTLDEINPNATGFSARFSGQIVPEITGPQVLKVRADGAFRVWLDGDLILESDGEPLSSDLKIALVDSVATKRLKAGKPYQVKVEFERGESFLPAIGGLQGLQVSWAALNPPADIDQYDAVIAVVGRNFETEGEAVDPRFELPEQQGTMLKKVTKANPNTIVVMHGGGGMEMRPWHRNAGAIFHAFYSGQFGGQALAELVYGDVNPSGKLPITLDKKLSDNPSYPSYSDRDDYLGESEDDVMVYSEGLFSGYRGYDANRKAPLYPFGFGLSYTDFAFADIKVDSKKITEDDTIHVSFTVTNTGSVAGYNTAQLYVKPKTSLVDRPVKELKGFAKVWLEAGESKEVTIPLHARSFAYYKPELASWVVDPTRYSLLVGDSSRNIELRTSVVAKEKIVMTTRDSNPIADEVKLAIQVSEDDTY